VRVEKGLESKLERRPRYERDSRRELASLANDGPRHLFQRLSGQESSSVRKGDKVHGR
jgi:hypothetical protein